MSDAKPMTKAALEYRRLQGYALHQEATSGEHLYPYGPEETERAWQAFGKIFGQGQEGFLRRRQAS